MLSNERRICEYFMISGFDKNRKPYDLSQIYYQGEEIFNTNVEITTDFFHYKEPVVDIQIINGLLTDKLSDGFHIVDKTYSKQNKADLNGKASVDELYLCFRHGRDKPPITDIWAFNVKHKNTIIQEQWTLIEKTFNGHSANLNSSSSNQLYIGYRRAPENAPVDNLAVTDICIILKNRNELCPPAYSRVDVPIKRTPLSHTINICYKKSMVKQHVLSFQPEIIYCLPSTSTEPIVDVYNPDLDKVKPQSCLPVDICDVANFCMPWGATLESWSDKRLIPNPSFLTFVLTNVNYNRMYGAAVLFYEEISQDELSNDEIVNLGLTNVSTTNDTVKIYCSKSLCLLSRWPLFQTFNQVLSFLIQEDKRQKTNTILNSSPYSLPIERFISQFLHTVAFPTPQAPNILLQWDLENPIGIQLPTDALSKFGTGENFYHLVRMLDVEQIIQLFVYMLTEQKILLTSTCNSDLTGISEALIAMIFPFKWSVVYIPFLYLRCIHIIQSPSPYLIGVDSRFFDFFRLPEGVGCIDLVTKSIKPPDNNCKYLDYNKVLPKSVLKSLRNGLSSCKTKVTSFEKQQNIRKTTGNVMDEFTIIRKRENIGESIRECFLRGVILMFKNYQSFLIPLSFRQKQEDMFNVEEFLKSVDRNCRILYQAIFETQLWNNFILERSYATSFDDGLAFFDRCIKSMRDMDDDTANATTLLQTDSVIKSEHTKVVPPPDPVDGWVHDTSRNTFPRRLNSHFMFAPIHVIPTMTEEIDDENYVVDLNYTLPLAITYDNRQDHGSSVSLTIPDSSIPVLLIRPDPTFSNQSVIRNRRNNKVTMLKRPVEELKQARVLGIEAKQGGNHDWAGHLLSSAYCLWYLSLPGLIGYVQETPGLKETGLTDRILQLALQLLGSMNGFRLILPDEVCYRVLLILIHQLRPARLHVSELLKHAELNAFSYGLCNQIILEEEQELNHITTSNILNVTIVSKNTQIGDSNLNDENEFKNVKDLKDENELKNETNLKDENELKDEKDCDSGRATIASTSLVPEEAQDSSDSGCNIAPKQDHSLIEIGGKSIQLRGRHQASRNRKNQVSQLITQSPMDLCTIDTEKNRQFLDPKAGIIMSSITGPSAPILALYRSPNSFKSVIPEELTDQVVSDIKTDTRTPAIITRTPFSVERSELHASFLTKKRISDDSNNLSESDRSSNQNSKSDLNDCVNINDPSKSDSRLTQSDSGADKVVIKTRPSFRQFKSVANKSLRNIRDVMNSMGSGAWLTPIDNKNSLDSKQKPFPAGLPTPFRPWVPLNNIQANVRSSENRLKTTASADLLDTMGDHNESYQVSRTCAGTVQQMRRHTNLSGIRWTRSDSCDSFCSDQKFDQDSSTTSLDTVPLFAITDNVYDKITGALGSIRLPTGRYWEDQMDGESSDPCIECPQNVNVYMTTCTDCDNCHQSVYDDDIMNGWSQDDSDLQSSCPYCCSTKELIRFTPKLSFQVFISHLDPDMKKPISNNRSSLAYSSIVNYLSPFVLRKELESVLEQEGEIALLKPDFLQDHGILYWNLVWYYSRLGLPTHLLSFLTLWLNKKGELLAATNEENRHKYQVLVDLTGFEQVTVSVFWEFNQVHGRVGLPLYRRYLRDYHKIGNMMGPSQSPTKSTIYSIINNIIQSDLSGALCDMLGSRRRDVYVTNNMSPSNIPYDRSIYRELYFLMKVALEDKINFEVFHSLYDESWNNANKRFPNTALRHDIPPSEKTLFCRKVFRPLLLSLQ